MLNQAKDLIELLKEWRGFDLMWDAMQHEQRAELTVALSNFLNNMADDIQRRSST